MSGRALKVAVELRVSAVSCPGVHLLSKDDVYVSVSLMEQHGRSRRRPPVFPIIFEEKMSFEKIFRHAVDPGDIGIMLEDETVRFNLVQLTPPVGETLACFEEDTLRFLFPEPRLVPCFSGKEREVLMTRAPHFPGIAPRLEFSTKTTITQCSSPSTDIHSYPQLHTRQRDVSSSSPMSCSAQRLSFSSSATPSAARWSLPERGASSSWTLEAESSEEEEEEEEESSCSHTPPDCGGAGVSRSEWEEVHDRVRGLLTAPRALRRLLQGDTHSEGDELWG